jgi:hypothetical protein
LIRQDFPDFSAPTITIRTRIGRGLGPVGFDDLMIEVKVSVCENASSFYLKLAGPPGAARDYFTISL